MYLIILFLAVGSVKADNSIARNKIAKPKTTRTDYLLPATLKPFLYQIELEPHFETESYVGSINITFSVMSPTNAVVLHKNELQIDTSSISLLDGEGNTVNEVVETSYSNDDKHFYTITLKESLVKEATYTLVISSFNNTLAGKTRGFYLAIYKDENGVERKLATTHMEPIAARTAFPCFDEPALKAEFEITVIRPAGYNSISNMPQISEIEISEGRFQDKFARSVKMSTYLVAIVVSDYANVSRLNHRVFGEPVDIANDGGDFALETGIKMLSTISEFLNVSYTLPKMDQIAIPDEYYAPGAMENWGLVTYKTSLLIYEGKLYSDKTSIAQTIAHEFAHQWFGNLVSPIWWSYLWLNEGFARYSEYYFASKVLEDDELLDKFNVKVLQPTLREDAYIGEWSMNEEVGSPEEIGIKFYNSYEKPASVLRMVHHFLSTEVFRKGLNIYLNKMQFQNAHPQDLYSSWQQALDEVNVNPLPIDKDIASVLGTWDSNAGYPLITVERNYSDGSVTISQRKFLVKYPENNDSTIWYVPITYTTGKSINFSVTTPKLWLTTRSMKVHLHDLDLDDWLIVNIQQTGYYRVNYDSENWERIINFLSKRDFHKIHHLNRAQILDDSCQLLIANIFDTTLFSKMKKYTLREDEKIPLRAFAYCRGKFDMHMSNTKIYDKFQSIMASLLDNAINSVGFEESENDTHSTRVKRDMILTLACEFGRQDCKEYGLEKIKELKKNGNITLSTTTPFICAGIRIAEQSDWDLVFQKYTRETEPTTRTMLLEALACSENEDINNRFLNKITRNNSEMKEPDRYTALMSMCSSNAYSRNYLFEYIKKNFNKVSASLSAGDFESVIQCISSKLSTYGQYADMQVLSKVSKTPTVFEEALTTIRSNIEEGRRILPSILTWVV